MCDHEVKWETVDTFGLPVFLLIDNLMAFHFGISFSYLLSACLPLDTRDSSNHFSSGPDTSIIDMLAFRLLLYFYLFAHIPFFLLHSIPYERMKKCFSRYVCVTCVLTINVLEISRCFHFYQINFLAYATIQLDWIDVNIKQSLSPVFVWQKKIDTPTENSVKPKGQRKKHSNPYNEY